MVGNRRNFIFRVSLLINVCVLLYAAMHLSGGPGQEWAPVSLTGGDSNELRYIPREELRNDNALLFPTTRNYDESTSQKTPSPSTAPTVNNTASSTAATTEKKAGTRITRSDMLDENILADDTLLRLRALLDCRDREFQPRITQRGEFWVLVNYVRAEHGHILCHESITITTHAGYDFLDNIPTLVERWKAPVSLAIHAPGSDLNATLDSIRYLRDCLPVDLVKQYVTFHVFFSFKHIPDEVPDSKAFLEKPYVCPTIPPYAANTTSFAKKNHLLYPVNVARNIARDAAMTHFVLPSDIELYPSPKLVPKFLNMIARNEYPLNNSTKPRVFTIPLFEVAANVHVPSSKNELQSMLAKKTAIPFHTFVCPSCHNIPKGKEWMKANETNQMGIFHIGKRIGRFMWWEPVFIGTHQDPYYDERLSWEGKKDKMTQGYVLCVKDYDFMILNNAFLTHKPGIKKYFTDKKRDQIAGRQSAFVRAHIAPELKKIFGHRAGCVT